jgi:cell division protein FtsZ
MVMPGLINLDFADVRSVMGEMGKAMMGTGEAAGENRAIEAAEKAISNPLLDGVSMKGAKGVIISITGGDDMRLMEVDEAASHIKELVDPDANIIWGSAFNNDLGGKIRVSVVATGIEAEQATVPQAGKVFTFPNSRGAPAPAPAPVRTTTAASSLPRAQEQALAPVDEDDTDELLLDSDDILTSPVGSAPIAPPADEDITGDDGNTPVQRAAPPVPARESGTLFERMSNIARGAAKAQVDDGGEGSGTRRDPVDIPRFLNRQNNQ